MADQLYLSLWFPNFRLENLPQTLTSVLRQFAVVSKQNRVTAASAIPIDFSEAPTYQRIYVNDPRAAETPETAASTIEAAVAEATEQLHDDMAYEFEMKWPLWYPEGSQPAESNNPQTKSQEDLDDTFEDIKPRTPADDTDQDANGDSNNPPGPEEDLEDSFNDIAPRRANQPIPFPRNASALALASLWKQHPTTVRILGFGPEFDQSGYAQNGHVRVDFGLDTPWTFEDAPGTQAAETATHIKQNIEMLLAFTLLVEKQCNISSRLLWTESGEPLAEKLIARLQRLN